MASKQLILHVGLHKTATSSFQSTCGENRKKLEKKGIHFPQFRIDDRKIHNHSIPVFSLFCENPDRYNTNIKWGYSDQIEKVNAIYKQQLEQALNDHDKVLLSGEDISVLPAQQMIALRDYLTGKGFELRVLCSVRRPYSAACSAMQQKIRGGILSEIPGDKIVRKAPLIRVLKETFNDIEFFSFEKDLRYPGGPVSALLDRIGVANSKINQSYMNEGLGNISTRLYASINSRYPVLVNGKMNPKGRGKEVQNFDDNRFLLTTDELLLIRDALDAENRDLQFLLGDEFIDDEYTTSRPFSIDLEAASKMLIGASKPAYVRDAVESFLFLHSDNTWGMRELAAVKLTSIFRWS